MMMVANYKGGLACIESYGRFWEVTDWGGIA